MMAQYIDIKAANPDSLLFYRMGDFYELFFSDAEIASRALGITLTKRGKHLGEDIPMCGVPVHAADDYLQKLIALGHRVAVCEQVEDPAEAKKRGSKSVVRRDVVRLVTPGTITEDRLLHAFAGAKDDDTSVQHAQATFHFGRKVDVSWRVDQVDVDAVPPESDARRIDGDPALLFLFVKIGFGGSLVDIADAMGRPAVKQHSLGHRRFAGVDMGDDADVA